MSRGVFVVAFGEPARACARRLFTSLHRFMPGLPIALCAATPIGGEDVFLAAEDSDIGGRRAKLRAYELAPAEWDAVLYLDADTELVAPIDPLFAWVESGWEFVICRDVGETLHSFARKNNLAEFRDVQRRVGTLYALQYNGGVWAFRRCDAVARFMTRWRTEWETYAQRDQGALIRALHAEPLRVLTLTGEWNTMPKYMPGVVTAGILHYPMEARRWAGKIPGRIDSAEAWAIVAKHEAKTRGALTCRRS